MATQTVTTAVNYDDASISGLLNGETITNNGGSLTINSDVRWNQQAAVMGNINCSSVLGGSVLIDGTTVWELTFTASTGNVPTQGALGTNGVTGGTSGATGELLRVWATGVLTPSAAGGAMPATGWIKLRTTNGTFQAGEIVTLPGGATITIADAGKRSWLHIVGGENLSITAARVSGTCSMTGDWYELGTTNGTDDQTFQFPVADYCPAIQIETAVGSGTYEWWLYADNRWGTATQFVATDVRGKYFGMDIATGVITIARRATNPCGFKPVAGLRVRVPNIICSSSSSANWNANTFSTTVTSRYRGVNISSAVASVSYDKICCNWDLLATGGSNFTLTNSALMAVRSISNCTGTVTVTNIGIGCMPITLTATAPLVVAGSGQVVVTDVRVVKRESDNVNDNAILFSTAPCTVDNVQGEMFGATGSAQRSSSSGVTSIQFSRCYASTINNLIAIGGSITFNTFAGEVDASGFTIADCLVGTSQTTISVTSFLNITTSSNMTVTGPFNWFGNLSNVQTFGTIVACGTASRNIVIQNIGTSATPLDCGGTAGSIFSISDADNVIVRRCYVNNTRTNVIGSMAITATNCTVDNCAGDYADATQVAGVSTKWRGNKTNLGGATPTNVGTNIADMFTSATAGRIVFTGNDASPTDPQLVISGGTGAGTSGAGAVILPNLNDTATWESPWFHLGHTALANTALVLTGTNTGNFNYDFQYDLGSGWNGTWLSATGANLSGIGAINPAVGIKLKMRATTAVASATNAIQFINVITVTDAVSQDTLYPFPFDAAGSVTNLIAGSRVQVYNQTTSAEITNTSVAGTSYSFSYYNGTGISAGDTVRIRVAKLGYLPQTLLAIATATGFSATANQQADAIYNANAVDGSAVTEFAADYPNIQVDISDPDGSTTVQRIYAWLRYIETTSSGIAQWFNAVTATDEVNYLIDASMLNLKLDNTQPTPVLITGGRLYKSDSTSIIATLSSSIQMDPNRVYSTGGGSSLTAADVWTYSTRTMTSGGNTAVASAVRTELSSELARLDVATSTRLATSGYTAPPSASAIRTEIDANSTKLDVAVSTRLATSGYTAPPTAASNATAVRTELATELGRIDVAVSSRNATAPDNAGIAAVKAKTDALPASPAAVGDIPSAATVASQVRTELATELGRIDVATSTRLATAGYTAPPSVSDIRTEMDTNSTKLDVAVGTRLATSGYTAPPSAATNATAVRSELSTELSRVDATISSRALETTAQAVKAKTDTLPAAPASDGKVQEAVDAAKLAVALSA